MQDSELVIQGQVTPDGLLQLGSHPRLPVGPVEVVIRPAAAAPPRAEDWWECLQRSRAELECAGHPFRSKASINAQIEELRSGDERIDEIRDLTAKRPRA